MTVVLSEEQTPSDPLPQAKPREPPSNYYSLRRQADKAVQDCVNYLAANSSKQVSLSALALQFQQQFGFGTNLLHKLLELYVKNNQVEIVDGFLRAKA